MGDAFADKDVVVYEPMGMPRLDVILSRDSIWMTMQQMGQVFGVDRSVVGKHIRNIYKTGELEQGVTWAKIAQVHKEGKREVVSNVELGVETIINTLMPSIVNRKPIGFNVDR